MEICVDYIRATTAKRFAPHIEDPQPLGNPDPWRGAGRAASVGIFLLLFGAFLYVGRPILLPILAAAIIAMTLAPVVRAAKNKGVPRGVTAIVIVAMLLGVLCGAATVMAGPVSQWIGRAPEIGSIIKERLSVLQPPLAALHELTATLFGSGEASTSGPSAPSVVFPVVAFLTPAAGETLLFFGALLFLLIGQSTLRNNMVALFADRDAKLRFLKIVRDIERNLASYLAVVTVVNIALGVIVATGVWLIGYPNPIIFGVVMAFLNYVPYVGPAIMVAALFGVGLVTFPSLGHAFLAPVGLIALTAVEGHFITPMIVGRRLTLNPLLLFLALAFWTWIWGPVGTFLAVPLCIVGLVVFHHLFPMDDGKLPE
jgi:predicted PurR-regulated permease PerM